MSRTLEQWLVHQTQVHPQTIDLGLSRSQRVLERLGWRQPQAPVVTVAGTNGKGSVSAYCAAILAAAGYRVGMFTSPHLRDYRERIRVHDRLVSGQELVTAFERLETARLAPEPIALTFFEFNALAAFLIFEAAGLDAWVLEVGMGGRLDAVNVVDASVAVVVSIGFDHQEFLGSTLDAIAREKAGIFRPGRAAVLGSRDSPPALSEVARAVAAPVKQLGTDYDCTVTANGWRYTGSRWTLPGLPSPALEGTTQIDNAATAIAALEELDTRLIVSPTAVAQGLRAVRLVGRFQVIRSDGQPTWILDVAHNEDAARVLAHNLRATRGGGRTFAVCSILSDKDVEAIAAQVHDCFDAWWLAAMEGPRGTDAAVLAGRVAARVSVPLTETIDVAAACAAAAAVAAAGDRIVVFGSFHTVGPALDWLERRGILPAPVSVEV